MALWECLNQLLKTKEEIKEQIFLLGEKYKEDIGILTSMSGISVFIALAIISDYGSIERFKNAKQFCKYLRNTPRTKRKCRKEEEWENFRRMGEKFASGFYYKGWRTSRGKTNI